jgi:hypothetical protein
LPLAFLALLVVPSPSRAQITYDPTYSSYFVTGDATINTDLGFSNVFVGKDNATSFATLPGPFTVTIADGANVGGSDTPLPDGNVYDGVSVFGNNAINMTGGSASAVFSYNTSTVNLAGGFVDYLGGTDTSSVTLSGDTLVGHTVFAGGASHVRVNDGFIKDGLETYDASTVDIRGGTIRTTEDFTGLLIGGTSTVNFYGGDVEQISVIYDRGHLNLLGGTLPRGIYQWDDTTLVRVGGRSLDFFGPSAGTDPNTEEAGTYWNLAWTQASGAAVNVRYFDLGGSVTDAAPQGVIFVTAAPEPDDLSLAVGGFLASCVLSNARRGRAVHSSRRMPVR